MDGIECNNERERGRRGRRGRGLKARDKNVTLYTCFRR